MSVSKKEKSLDQFLTDRKKAAYFTDDVMDLNVWRNHLVFVYGTLRRGFSRNAIMEGSCEFQNYGFTERDDLCMRYAKGAGFPGVFMARDGSPESGRIFGEIWKVPTDYMIYLDQIEQNGILFDRVETDIMCASPMNPDTDKSFRVQGCWLYYGSEYLEKQTAFTKLLPDFSSMYGKYYTYKKQLVTQTGRISAE